jgi:hypothetical protein
MPRGPNAWVVPLLVGALAGCAAGPGPARQSAPPPVVAKADGSEAEHVVEQTRAAVGPALERPDVSHAFELAFDQIAADPEVSRAGSALFQRLGDDREIAKAGEPILQRLGEQPDFQAAILRFRAAHPDDFEAAFGAYVDRLFESPRVDAAIGHAVDALFELPRVNRAMEGATKELLKSGEIQAAFARSFVRALTTASRGRLPAELGVREGDPRYGQAFAEYLAEPTRLERLLVEFARVFGSHPAPRRAVVGILRSDEFFRASVVPTRALLADEEFGRLAVRGIVSVVAEAETSEIEARAHDLMTCDAAERSTAHWLASVARSAKVTTAFADALTDVADSPELARAIERIYFSGERTASNQSSRPVLALNSRISSSSWPATVGMSAQ